MIVRTIKSWLLGSTRTASVYVLARDAYHRARKLVLHGRDASATWRDMRWRGAASLEYWVLSAELLFQFHKLEKGLSMPGPRRFFGYDPATATLDILERWQRQGLPRDHRIHRGAVATLQSYRTRLDETPPAQGARLIARLDAFLAANQVKVEDVLTPQPVVEHGVPDAAAFDALMHARRSMRDFDEHRPVDRGVIEAAVRTAQGSPSACNRQPWHVHVYQGRRRIDAMLRWQDGNRGFGHRVPVLLVLTADARGFFDASERHEPYVDGGLFAMSLILALRSHGLHSCCLNWCVEADADAGAHREGDIHPAERIVMYLAVGHAAPGAVVPRSPRRPLEDVLTFHPSQD